MAFKEAQETQNENEIEKRGNILRKGREKWMTSNGCSVSFFRSREQIIYPQFPLALRRNLKPILSWEWSKLSFASFWSVVILYREYFYVVFITICGLDTIYYKGFLDKLNLLRHKNTYLTYNQFHINIKSSIPSLENCNPNIKCID